MPEEEEGSDRPWFGKSTNRLGFGPLNWQGRAATFLYVFLVIVAIFLYSQLGLTIFVIAFYTVAFGLVVAMKSDLMKGWPPGS
jgi:hypothetical protein